MRGLLLVGVSWIAGLTNRELHFGIGIILGTIPSGFPIFEVIVAGCSRNSSGAFPYLRVRKKLIKFGDRAPKIRDSNWLNSWDSFLVTLPSISSDTWVMYSSVIPGTNVFGAWLFLAFSWVSLETAANYRFFVSVAIISEEGKSSTVVKTE